MYLYAPDMLSWRAQEQLYLIVYILLTHYIWGLILQLLNFKSHKLTRKL
jgi:hypothetical protein